IPLSVPTPHNARVRSALRRLRGDARQLIEDERTHPGPRRTIITALLEGQRSGRSISDADLERASCGIFLAAHSSVSVLTWAVWLAARDPELADRLRSEDVAYAERFLRETMRMHTPEPALPRTAIADTTIADHAIPAGTTVLLLVGAMNRRPELFPDPDRFDPDRFLTGPDLTMPFGAGPHRCPGAPFAQTHNPRLLQMAVRRFDLAGLDAHVPDNYFF